MELMVVVAIIGILVATAIPLFVSASAKAAERACFYNQRYLEGATETWVGSGNGRKLETLAGTVNESHPLAQELVIGKIPRCPSAGEVGDSQNPTPAEGAYVFGDYGQLESCPFGQLTPHQHY